MIQTTGNMAPCGVIARTSWGDDVSWSIQGVEHPGHVATEVIHETTAFVTMRSQTEESEVIRLPRKRRKPNARFRWYNGFLHLGEAKHYWLHRCRFNDGLMIGPDVLSVLITRSKFIGSHTGLNADKARGPIVVDHGVFKGQTGYGIFSQAPLAVLHTAFLGAGSATYHGIRLMGGANATIRECDFAVSQCAHPISCRDSGRDYGGTRDWEIINAGTKHVTIVGCRRRRVATMFGSRWRNGMNGTLQIGPQNPKAAAVGAFGAKYIDVINNDIHAMEPQREAIRIDGPAHNIRINGNRLWTWDEGATPVRMPDGTLIYNYHHINERDSGYLRAGDPTHVVRGDNLYMGKGQP